MQSQSVHMTHALGPGNHDQVFGWALSQKHMEREILNGWFIQKVRSFRETQTAQSIENFVFSDSSGRICGYDFGVHDKPFLMYYNPLACLDSGLPGEG